MDLKSPDTDTKEQVKTSDIIRASAFRLSRQLEAHVKSTFAPNDEKVLRSFSLSEAADILGTSTSNLRKLHTENKIPDVDTDARNRRTYRVEDIDRIRKHLAKTGRTPEMYMPGRRGPEDKLQVISIANFKGGSAKSTSTAFLARYMALRGLRVLTIDFDPQASLTTTFGISPNVDPESEDTIYDVITYDNPKPLKSVIKKTYFPGLDLVPSGVILSEYESETAMTFSHMPPGQAYFYARLSAALKTVDDDYDLVLIDCPPQIGFLTLTALCASTGVLITILPEMIDVASMAQFQHLSANLIETIEARGMQIDWDFMKYVITRHKPHDAPQQQMVGFLRMIFGPEVFEHYFVDSTVISDAGLTGDTLFEIDPSKVTKSSYDRAMRSFQGVARELEVCIQKAWGRDPGKYLSFMKGEEAD